MADKSISELVAATAVGSTDLFVLEQTGTAKKLTGQILENWLVALADGHGGIQTVAKTGTSGLVDTYTITYADTTTSTFTVTNGKALTSITQYWAVSTSGSTVPSSWSTTRQTMTATNKYLWSYMTFTYNDGTSSDSTKSVVGVYGDTGAQTYVWIKYAGVQPTSDSDMGDTPDNWIGIYTGLSSTAPTAYTAYAWYEYKGEKGDTGDASTITSQSVTYMESSSGTVVPTGSWTTTVPSVTAGNFLWTRTILNFNDLSTVTAYSVARFGIDGTGSVSTVNSISPDTNGNVAVNADDIPMESDNLSVESHVSSVESNLANVSTKVKNHKRRIILVGDSYGLDTANWTGWQTALENMAAFTIYKTSVGGSGFIGDTSVNNFLTQLQNLSVSDKETITDIVVMGGYNDSSLSYTEAQLLAAVQEFSSYCATNYPYANVHYGFIAISYLNTGMQATLNSYRYMFERICGKSNVSFIPNAPYILLDRSKIFLLSGNANSGFHPNTTGNAEVAKKLSQYLTSGYFDVIYGEQFNGINVYVKNGEASVVNERYPLYGVIGTSIPYNTWTTLKDFGADGGSNYLWGTHAETTTVKFTLPIHDNNGFKAFALFRLYDKKLQVNALYSPGGLTLTANAYALIQGIAIPMQMNY